MNIAYPVVAGDISQSEQVNLGSHDMSGSCNTSIASKLPTDSKVAECGLDKEAVLEQQVPEVIMALKDSTQDCSSLESKGTKETDKATSIASSALEVVRGSLDVDTCGNVNTNDTSPIMGVNGNAPSTEDGVQHKSLAQIDESVNARKRRFRVDNDADVPDFDLKVSPYLKNCTIWQDTQSLISNIEELVDDVHHFQRQIKRLIMQRKQLVSMGRHVENDPTRASELHEDMLKSLSTHINSATDELAAHTEQLEDDLVEIKNEGGIELWLEELEETV